jgi:hypothetical protein
MTPIMGEVINKKSNFINYAWWETLLKSEQSASPILVKTN